MLQRLRLVVHAFNQYRLDVGLLYFLLAFFYLREFTLVPASQVLILSLVLMMSIVSTYLFNRFTDRVEDQISQPGEVLPESPPRIFRTALILLAVLPVIVLWIIGGPVHLYLPIVAIGYLYGLPLTKRGFRIKQVTFLKNLYSVVLVWIGPIALFLLALPHRPMIEVQLFRSLAYAASLIFAYELVWDIRDIAGDRIANVKTIPVMFGELATKILAFFSIILGLSLYWPSPSGSLMTNTLYVGAGIVLAHQVIPRWYFHALLYGQMLLLVLIIHT